MRGGEIIPVKSFRLTAEQTEMYDSILKKLGIEGDNESDKFRSLIEYMYDYVDANPATNEPRSELTDKFSGDRSRLDVLDLIIHSLKEHEVNLDKLVSRLERPSSIIADAERGMSQQL